MISDFINPPTYENQEPSTTKGDELVQSKAHSIQNKVSTNRDLRNRNKTGHPRPSHFKLDAANVDVLWDFNGDNIEGLSDCISKYTRFCVDTANTADTLITIYESPLTE